MGQISPELNEGYSREFSKYIEEKLNIPNDRGYIGFFDPGRANLGYLKLILSLIINQVAISAGTRAPHLQPFLEVNKDDVAAKGISSSSSKLIEICIVADVKSCKVQ